MLHPLRPTPHGVGAIPTPLSLTPLYFTPIAVPRIRFGWRRARTSFLHRRTRLLAVAGIGLLVASAPVAVGQIQAHQSAELERRALGEAEMVATSLMRPLRESGYAPDGNGLHTLVTRVERLASITITHETRIDARLVAPGVVEVVTRARVADGSGTVVCMAALRWEAEALPPTAFGPRCGVQWV